MRPAGAEHAIVLRPRRRDEIDLGDKHPPRMLLAKQNHPRHQMVEIGRTERTGPAHPTLRIGISADQVDVGCTVDLPATEKERVNPPLRGEVKQLDAAIGEGIVAA